MGTSGRRPRKPRSDGKYRCSQCSGWFEVSGFQVRNDKPLSWCLNCTHKVVIERRIRERHITARAREILASRAEYASWKEIGQSIGVSRQRAEQIAITALAKLIRYREKFVAQDFF